MKLFFGLGILVVFATGAFADPQLTAWLTNYSGQYARVYTTTARRTSGTSSTTWTNQSTVAYADIAQVLYSANWVYVRYPDLPSHVIGPWLNPQGAVGTLWPSNQKNIAKFPRNPSVPAKKSTTGTGYSGNYVNGVAIFNSLDGKAWNNSALVNSPHTRYTNYWHQNAPVAEDFNFDYSLGHQNPAGVYHTHQNPLGLRYQLGDHISFNSSTKAYTESTNAVSAHSPIIGYAYDGYPVYGPYGYSVSNNPGSGVRRMVSGYVKRDGTNGTDQVATNLNVIPLWYARYRTNHFFANGETTIVTTIGTNRPAVNSTYPLGNFAQDWAYLGDLTNSATGSNYIKSSDFDLDEYNGRVCVTPEYTNGTYAYFVSIDSSGSATYPYVFGFEYYGNPTGTNDAIISEPVTTNFLGASDAALKLNAPTINTSNYLITLVWSSTEGGTYMVESSTNNVNWNTERTDVAAAAGVSSTTNYTSAVSNGTVYVRLTRTALATNDSVGGATGIIGQTNVQSFALANSAPGVANPIPPQTATYGAGFSYTFPTNTFTDADAGQTLTYSATSSAFTNTGIGFNGTTRTLSATTVDATNGGTIATSYPVSIVATDNGSPAQSATNTFTLTINKAAASVTASNFSRAYGTANPALTGALTGIVSSDGITANYSTTATTNSVAGSYPITVTLSDPDNRLGNYSVTTNSGTLTVTNATAATNYTATVSVTNSIVTLGTNGSQNFTFTDPANGLAVVVALTMTPYSGSNASPAFTPLDAYGPGGSPVHLGVESGLGGGDGNFVQPFEGANFSATLVSASNGILTNTIRFGIAGIGFRFSPVIAWNSSVGSNSVTGGGETLFTLDTGTATIAGTGYSATLRSTGASSSYQFSDTVDNAGMGLALTASFFEGTTLASPTLSQSTYTNSHFQLFVAGSAGADYIVQTTTNLSNWITLATNTSPFIFTDTNAASYSQRFYRAIAP